MLTRFSTSVRNGAHDVGARTGALVHESTVRLAVTGLSRAGKTVFVTSLLANLLAMGRGHTSLPALHRALGGAGAGGGGVGGLDGPGGDEAGGGGPGAGGAEGAGLLDAPTRLRSVRLVPPGHGDTPVFDLARNLAALTAPSPDWPPRTDDLTETAIELTLDHTGMVRRHLGARRLRLEILDYPGEWLLDLPLLDQSFPEWSRETLNRLRQGAREKAFAPFLDRLASVTATDAPDDAHLRRLHRLYRDGLHAAQATHGLRLLQPGRFLCPGPGAEAPFLLFFPLPDAPEHPRHGTLALLLQKRFEAYKADMRARFFEAHFARFDRQVLLADVLGALHGGHEAFEDTREALALIAASLAARRRPLGIGPARPRHGRITRVAFAATKADHVPATGRIALRRLLEDLVAPARASLAGVETSFHAIASVHSTQDATVEHEGVFHDVVRGIPLGETRAKLFDPGTVPAGRPPEAFWDRPRFVLPVFEPPRDRALGPKGVPHLGLDTLLATLLKGKL